MESVRLELSTVENKCNEWLKKQNEGEKDAAFPSVDLSPALSALDSLYKYLQQSVQEKKALQAEVARLSRALDEKVQPHIGVKAKADTKVWRTRLCFARHHATCGAGG